jgi:glycosyltransferase involved in cell wall biosynthesis
LAEDGYRVTVIHGSYIPANIEIDLRIAQEIGSCTAVRFGPVTLNRLDHMADAIRQKVAKIAVRLGVQLEFVEMLANSQITPRLIRAACAVQADLYIAHYVAALPAAVAAAKRYGSAYAFDAEDFHLGDLPDLPEHAVEKRIIRSIEGRYLPGAAFVTAASPLIAEAYVDAYRIPKPNVILNVFPKGNGKQAPTPRGSARPSPSLYWFSQTIGAGRGLETAVEAIALAQSRPHLHLRGTFASGYEATLRALANRHSVADHLHFHPPLPPNEMEVAGADFDVGYVGELDETQNRSIALTNKLFSYLVSGIPVIATDIPAHQAIANDLGGAFEVFPIGDAQALAEALDRMLLNPSLLFDARKAAWELGHGRWNWEHERELLLTVVSEWRRATADTYPKQTAVKS